MIYYFHRNLCGIAFLKIGKNEDIGIKYLGVNSLQYITLEGLKNATMGIFQITGQNSSEDYSWGGAFNTSSKRKTASITMRLEYLVD
jgi:hypothetical protein